MHLVFLLSLAASLQWAAPPDTTLPEVSVVATRHAVSPVEAPGRVQILTRADIEASGSNTTADLLERVTSTFIRRYGPAGLASLSMRGGGASQTLVLLDGYRIADPQLGQLDFSLLPTILLDGVEVMYGSGSALHGTDAMTGVVALRSRSAAQRGASAYLTAGAFGERSGGGVVSFSQGRFSGVLAGEGLTAEGDFPYFDPNVGNTGELVRRTGSDRTTGTLFGRLGFTDGSTRGTLGIWAGTADRGIPGSIGAPTTARQVDQHLRIWTDGERRFTWGTLRAGGLVQRAGLGYNEEWGRTRLTSGDVEVRALRGRWLLAGGIGGGFATANHQHLAEDAAEGRMSAHLAATGQFGRLFVYPALRSDLYLRSGTDDLAAVNPRLGFNYRLLDWLYAKASAGAAFRAPTFNDRFWRFAGAEGVGGDPDLRPERGRTLDGGVLAEVPAGRAEVTVFLSDVRDQIVWLPTAGGTVSPFNVGRARTRGLEATIDATTLQLGPASLVGGLNYSLTDARDRSDSESASFDQPLRYVPRHQMKGRVAASTSLGRFSLSSGADGRLVSARPVRTDGTLFEPAYFVADGRVRLAHAAEGFTSALTLSLENIFNADYAALRGYPMPPRHARATLQISF